MNRVQLRNIWVVTLADGLSSFGNQLQFLAVTSVTYAVTKSPLATSLQMAISCIPYIVLANAAGRLVDRKDPRVIIASVSLLRAFLALAYIFAQTDFALIMVLNLLTASLGAFSRPAQSALVPILVGREQVMKANARRSSIMGVIQLFGPALAGWAIVRTSANWAFVFNSLSYLPPAAAMVLVRVVTEKRRYERQRAVRTRPSTDAWNFFRARRDRTLILLAHFGFSLGMWAINSLFYPYTSDVLGRGPEALGLFTSAYYGASLLAGVVMEKWGNRFQGRKLLLGAYATGTLVWMGYTLMPSVQWVTGLNVLDGTIFTLVTVLFQTRIQKEAPSELHGRVFALFYALEEIGSATGMILGGWAATIWGVMNGFRFSVGLSLAIIGFAAVSAWRQKEMQQTQREPLPDVDLVSTPR